MENSGEAASRIHADKSGDDGFHRLHHSPLPPLESCTMSTRSEKISDGSPGMKNVDLEGVSVFAETQDVFGEEDSGVDPVYQAKARILNDAFQQIGMGKYQVCSSY